MLEPTLRTSHAMTLDAFHNRVDARLECRIGGARLKLIGANATQKRLERVDHRQAHGNANRTREIHAKARVDVMRVSIVVRDNGNMRIPCIVERFTQQRRIVGKAAIADIFSRANSDIGIVVSTAFKRGERLANHDLRREAYVVVHVSLAELDSALAAQIERNGAHALLAKHRAHKPAERVRSIRHQNDFLATVGARELLRVRVGQLMWRRGSRRTLAASIDGLDERAHTNAQRARSVAFVGLQYEWRFRAARALAHQARDFVAEVGIVPATEAYELHVFQIRAFRGNHGARKHARVEIVHHIDQARRQIDVLNMRHRIGRQNRNAQLAEQLRKAMVHERIVMIGSAREHDRVGARLARGVESGTAPLNKLALEAFLSIIGHANSLARHIFVNTERLAHIRAQLAIAIGRREPMEQRRVERHIPRARRIVAALDHHGVSLHHGAHRNACFGTILGWHCRDDGHEDAIDPHASELAHVAMHDLRREAHRVRRDRGQAVFVHAPRAQARELHVEAQRAQKRRPKRRSVPQGQHARQTHGYMTLRAQRARGPLFE